MKAKLLRKIRSKSYIQRVGNNKYQPVINDGWRFKGEKQGDFYTEREARYLLKRMIVHVSHCNYYRNIKGKIVKRPKRERDARSKT